MFVTFFSAVTLGVPCLVYGSRGMPLVHFIDCKLLGLSIVTNCGSYMAGACADQQPLFLLNVVNLLVKEILK